MTPYRIESVAGTLARLARETPYAFAFRYLLDGETLEDNWTVARLDEAARRIAAMLPGTRQGRDPARVLLLYPPGPDYVAAFFGCVYAGAIAVPAYPPEPSRLARTLPRLRAIIADCGATTALTIEPIRELAASLLSDVLAGQEPLRWIATDTLASDGDVPAPEPVRPSTIAFLQYTSGSTTTPRGVMVTHGNLRHNIDAIVQRLGPREGFSGVTWLPPYHDMGLIGGILAPITSGLPATMLSPLDFLKRPVRWLDAITRYRGTCSPAPNFAFDLCVRKVTPEQRERIDLSAWRVAFNGAEPIDAAVLDRFTEMFGPCGFRRETFLACYGLAESTLIASGTPSETAPTVRAVRASALAQGRVEEGTARGDTRMLVGTGPAIDGQRIEIVDPEQRVPCSPEKIGEIWLSGPSVAQGYWNRPEESVATFEARLANDDGRTYLRTGDLGVVLDGQLFVTGRIKDVIIIAGVNHYPQDIERTVEAAHPLVRAGASAAFSVDIEDHERLAVVCETEDPGTPSQADEIRRAIRRAVTESHEIPPHAVVLLKRGALPRTSSGKVQRYLCREGFLAHTLEAHEV